MQQQQLMAQSSYPYTVSANAAQNSTVQPWQNATNAAQNSLLGTIGSSGIGNAIQGIFK
jgi:hypothetical protein